MRDQLDRQRLTTDRLLRQRAERMERAEANAGFATALDMFGPHAMLDMLNGADMITQYPVEWDYE